MAPSRSRLPRSDVEITAAWLTDALRPAGLAGRVVHVSTQEGAAGRAVTSRVRRLLLTVEGDPLFPRSLVAKTPTGTWTHGSTPHVREDRFYRELAPRLGRLVPRCLFSEVDEDGNFILLLEDLTGAGAGHPVQGLSTGEAALVVDGLADVHRAWWSETAPAGWSPRPIGALEVDRMRSRFAEFWPRLLESTAYEVLPGLAAEAECIPARLDAARALGAGPTTLSHSDLHPENLVLLGRGSATRVVFLDWQNARWAHPAFDLAGLLAVTAGDEAQRSAHGLLTRYVERLDRPLDSATLGDLVGAASDWIFVGITRWLVLYEEQGLRAPGEVQQRWRRLQRGLLTRRSLDPAGGGSTEAP